MRSPGDPSLPARDRSVFLGRSLKATGALTCEGRSGMRGIASLWAGRVSGCSRHRDSNTDQPMIGWTLPSMGGRPLRSLSGRLTSATPRNALAPLRAPRSGNGSACFVRLTLTRAQVPAARREYPATPIHLSSRKTVIKWLISSKLGWRPRVDKEISSSSFVGYNHIA